MAGGAINVFVKRLEPLVTPGEDVAGVVELAERRAAAAAAEAPADRAAAQADPSEILADFRGVAPAVQSFAAGRRQVSRCVSRAARTSNLPRRMPTLIFVLTWVVLGLGLLLVALSGGPSGALQRLQSQSRGSRKAAIALFVVALLVLGIGVPLAVISSVEARDDIPEANVSNLTAAEQHGRELFGAALHAVPHAGGLQRGRPGRPEPRHPAPAQGARARRDQERPRPRATARWRPGSTRARTPRTWPPTWPRPSGRPDQGQ